MSSLKVEVLYYKLWPRVSKYWKCFIGQTGIQVSYWPVANLKMNTNAAQKYKILNRSARVQSQPTLIVVPKKLIASEFFKMYRRIHKLSHEGKWPRSLRNNQPSAVICRVSCQQRPRGSACVKQTFAQRPFAFFFSFFFVAFFIFLVNYMFWNLPSYLVSCYRF